MDIESRINLDDFPHSCESNSRSTSVVSSSSTACHLCGYESGRVSNLKRHISKMHESNNVVDFHCCETRFEDKSKYREHCRLSHKNGHECSTCNRLFSRRALLRRHQSVHTGLKDFHCDLCFYASSHKSNLERHLKTHQGNGRLRKGSSQTQAQPDSTTANTPTFPILRDMLGSNSNTKSERKVKAKLSHSIESILRIKDKRCDNSQAKQSTSKSKQRNSTATSSPLQTPAAPVSDLANKSEFPTSSCLPEVNWSRIDGNPGLISNHPSSFTQDLRNLSNGNNSVLPSWLPTCLPISPPAQDSRFHTDYLGRSNLFSPYYTSHYEAFYSNYAARQQHPFLAYNNGNVLPAFAHYQPLPPNI